MMVLIRDLKQLRRRRHQQRQKTIGFMIKTTALPWITLFSTFLWRPLHDYDVNSQCDVLWRTWTYDERCSFLYLNMDIALKNSTPGKDAYIWRIERFQIDAIKFEKTQIHFFGDVFTTVVVVTLFNFITKCGRHYKVRQNTVALSSLRRHRLILLKAAQGEHTKGRASPRARLARAIRWVVSPVSWWFAVTKISGFVQRIRSLPSSILVLPLVFIFYNPFVQNTV